MEFVIALGTGMQVGVAPTFHGFHPIWASVRWQVDICNNVDDVIFRDGDTGTLYRVPITLGFLPTLGALVTDMNNYDAEMGSPWADHNSRVRRAVLYMATRRAEGIKPQSLNMFEPGTIAPALQGHTDPIDDAIAKIVRQSGESRIPGQ